MIKTISCPSKVLIAGGYSVLYENNNGLILSTSACYNSASQSLSVEEHKSEDSNKVGRLDIESEGFNTKWNYTVALNNNKNNFSLVQDSSESTNVFLEAAIKTALCYVFNQLNKPFHLKIKISNDKAFYSIEEIDGKKVFKKSGLGSSACFITVVLASILNQFGALTENQKDDLARLHILAQTANSIAQNKIGSGFDISSAIFGNQVYARFPTKEVELLVEAMGSDKDLTLFEPLVFKTLKDSPFEWLIPNQLVFPKSLRLWLIDLETGSDTRSFVKEILKYIQSDPEWGKHFFQGANKAVQEIYSSFKDIRANEEQEVADKGKLDTIYKGLRTVSNEYRSLLKQLGQRASVEVEPDLLTFILDGIMKETNEVIYSVCPGAGGYDAACLLSTQDLEEEQLEKILQGLCKEIKDKGECFILRGGLKGIGLFTHCGEVKIKVLPVQSSSNTGIKFSSASS